MRLHLIFWLNAHPLFSYTFLYFFLIFCLFLCVCLVIVGFFYLHLLSQLTFRAGKQTFDIGSVTVDGKPRIQNDHGKQIPPSRMEDQYFCQKSR